MAVRRRHFRPSLLPSVVVLIMLAALCSLGSWQLNRADEKQRLMDRYSRASELPTVDIGSLDRDWQGYQYRRIELSGEYDELHHILLENRIHKGLPGYLVLTPFVLAGGDKAVLVNRGWIAKAKDSKELIRIDKNVSRINGLVSHPPSVGMKMGSLDDSPAGWPKAIPYVETEWMALQLAKPILPWVVLLDPDEPHGFIREWQPSVRMGPEKHKGYAFQWFALAIALIFLFVAGSLKPKGAVANTQVAGSEDRQ